MTKTMSNINIYQDAHGQWRWWIFDDEGNIVNASEAGFDERQDCEKQVIEFGSV